MSRQAALPKQVLPVNGLKPRCRRRICVASCGQDLYQKRCAEPSGLSAGFAEGPWEAFERAAPARIASNASSRVSWLVCVAPMIQIMEIVVFLNKLEVLAGHSASANQLPLSRSCLESRQSGTKNAASRCRDEVQSCSVLWNSS